MTVKEKIHARTIIQEVAAKNGVSAAEVRLGIQEAIDAAWDNPDPAVRAMQHRLFPAGKPDMDTFLRRVAKEVR